MAKSKEEQLSHLYNARHHCTLKDLEESLEAFGFAERPRKKNNKHVWQWRGIVVVLHTPHKRFAKPGAVDDVITAIEAAEAARRTGNGRQTT